MSDDVLVPELLGFSPETFSRRRARVKESLGGGVLILPGAPVLRRSRDTELRYRPDSELFYLTGCTDPGTVAVLRDSEDDPFLLFVPQRDPKAEQWSGPRLGPEEAKERLAPDMVLPMEDLDETLPDLLKPFHEVFFRMGIHPRVEASVLRALQWARGPGSRTGVGPRTVKDPGEILDSLRMVKDHEEVSCLREAAALTVEAFRHAMSRTKPGMGEWEIEALLEGSFRKRGAMGPGFPTIVGSGPNGCVLHYTSNQDKIGPGDLVLLDGGAEVRLYSGDATRTYPAGPRFTPAQREVYDVVLAAHQSAISQVRPGVPVARVHEAALEELTVGLVGLGVLKGNVGDLVGEKAFLPFFPHQTSHWLGLDVHDVGDYAFGGEPKPLEAGMVLTVEPGLYFPLHQNSGDHPFSGLGIRIEDDLLVTDSGVENLTAALPVGPDEVEALGGSAFRE